MLYTVAVTVLFPGSILALAAGAVFGLVLGSLLVWLGTVLGQTLAFIIGRYGLLPLLPAYCLGLRQSARQDSKCLLTWSLMAPHLLLLLCAVVRCAVLLCAALFRAAA